jgi:hypothetical protein
MEAIASLLEQVGHEECWDSKSILSAGKALPKDREHKAEQLLSAQGSARALAGLALILNLEPLSQNLVSKRGSST